MKFVKIPNQKYQMLDTPVTQKKWTEVMGTSPFYFKDRPDNPAEMVSYYDVQEFIKKVNEKSKKYDYRLPTEEEWEYCCRAGSTMNYCFGNDEAQLGDYAWYDKNSNYSTQPVGQKKPNAWGLYDMHGNVCEWIDKWDSVYRVLRGGSWYDGAQVLRSGFCNYCGPGLRARSVGFRLVRMELNSIDIKELRESVAIAQEILNKILKQLS